MQPNRPILTNRSCDQAVLTACVTRSGENFVHVSCPSREAELLVEWVTVGLCMCLGCAAFPQRGARTASSRRIQQVDACFSILLGSTTHADSASADDGPSVLVTDIDRARKVSVCIGWLVCLLRMSRTPLLKYLMCLYWTLHTPVQHNSGRVTERQRCPVYSQAVPMRGGYCLW